MHFQPLLGIDGEGSAVIKWGAGIVNHGDYDDLECCVVSLMEQAQPPSEIAVWDTGSDPLRFTRFCSEYPGVIGMPGRNVGYAAGANRVIDRLRQSPTQDLEFLLVLNPDVSLDVEFAERLLLAVSARTNVAIATGKLLRPDRKILDSTGIIFPRHRRPRDRGSETIDAGQFDRTECVDAASGAALLLRVACLDDLMLEGEVFDEDFFAYHEDTDLCWRARRYGYDVLYEPSAVAVHARGWKRDARDQIPLWIRRHSFKNHYLQLVKNESAADFLRNSLWLAGWEALRLGFVLLRDPAMLPAYAHAWQLMPAALRRRRMIRDRIRQGRSFSHRLERR